jgi:regulator of sigma E protease
MQALIVFIIVFGIIVGIHEYGHLYFAKKAGIRVREFAIGMGPKLFAHQAKDGTTYTIRMLPLGGYVRMAGWGDDTTEIKTGTPVGLTLNESGVVTRVNMSEKMSLEQALPMFVTAYDFDKALTITGQVNGQTQTYPVDHDATIIEEDGTEIMIAPEDVQYQSASLLGRMMTNFAGPLNNFILGLIAFVLVVFMQGGVQDLTSNQITVSDKAMPAYTAGLRTGDRVETINGTKISDWQDLSDAISKDKDKKLVTVTATRDGALATYKVQLKDGLMGVTPIMKTGFMDKVLGGATSALAASTQILNALKDLIFHPDINKLGGPVAMYQMTGQAAENGITTIIAFMGMLSINLGIFNLIPIPALDGGKILMNIIEGIRRKPLKQETESVITLVGVAIMLVLMVAVTWNDIMRLFQ